jgi:hypothetical protein
MEEFERGQKYTCILIYCPALLGLELCWASDFLEASLLI